MEPQKTRDIYIYSHTTNKIPVVKTISSWFLTTNLTVGFIMDIKLWKLTNIRLVCWSALWGIVDIFISIIYRRIYILQLYYNCTYYNDTWGRSKLLFVAINQNIE